MKLSQALLGPPPIPVARLRQQFAYNSRAGFSWTGGWIHNEIILIFISLNIWLDILQNFVDFRWFFFSFQFPRINQGKQWKMFMAFNLQIFYEVFVISWIFNWVNGSASRVECETNAKEFRVQNHFSRLCQSEVINREGYERELTELWRVDALKYGVFFSTRAYQCNMYRLH